MDVAQVVSALTEASADQVEAVVAALGPETLHSLKTALDVAEARRLEDAIVAEVTKQVQAYNLPGVQWVVFTSDVWDDGIYFSRYPVAFCADGNAYGIEVGARAEDLITDLHGRVGSSAVFAVNPTTGDCCYDDDGTTIDVDMGIDRKKYKQV